MTMCCASGSAAAVSLLQRPGSDDRLARPRRRHRTRGRTGPPAGRCPAHAALARPGWWAIYDGDWGLLWHQLSTAASAQSPAALILLTRAAITGATLHAPRAGKPSAASRWPAAPLWPAIPRDNQCPQGSPPLSPTALDQIVPRPEHVHRAVAAELDSRGVSYPDAVAITLLPEAGST
jgi:hypothetical protein